MASEVDICNVALAHLGDTGTIASIDPPEGSAQAEHCARFYPMARDTLLELHDWNFATRRGSGAAVQPETTAWAYAYAKPNKALKVFAVLPPTADADHTGALGQPNPEPFICETDSNGNEIIYTAIEDAVLRYTVRVTDPTRFSSLFIEALTWKLAAMLAGPVIKGDVGQTEAKRCETMVQVYLGQARLADARQRREQRTHVPSSIASR